MIGADGHLSGYIQCVSQVFHVKEHSVKLLKVTATRDCFCHDSLNILVRWLESRESDDDRLARKKFLRVCSVGRFVMAKGLQEGKVYRGQARECVMWIYQPGFSEAETHPALLPCDPVKCPSWPVCLISRLSCRVHFVHKHGVFFTCTAVDDSLSPLSTLLGICTSFPDRHKLNPGRRIVFHNLWLCPMPSTAFAPYSGVVILGIFTACSQPPFSLIKNNQTPIPEESFLSDLMLPNKLIDVESLINRLLDIFCSTHTYQRPDKHGSSDVALSVKDFVLDIFQSPPSPTTQYTELFANFPLFYTPLTPSALPDDSRVHWMGLSELQQIFMSEAFLPTAPKYRCIRLPDQSPCLTHKFTEATLCSDSPYWHWVRCSHSVHSDGTSPDHSWCTQTLVARGTPSTSGSAALPVLFGRLLWSSPNGYFQINCLHSFPGRHPHQRPPDSSVCFPLVINRYHESLMDHPLPSNGTAVALLNWFLVCETTPSSNTCTSSTYIVAETVVPLELSEFSAPLYRLKVPNVDTDTRVIRLRLDQLGSIHQLPSQCPNLTFCYDVRGFHPENHSSSIKLRLIGPVALCWYYAFRLDSVYRLTTAELGLDLHQLFLAEREESGTDSLHCDHLLSINHVTTLLRLAPCLPNANQFEAINFKALLFHKSYSSDGLSLWLTSHDLTSLTSGRDSANLTEIVRLCLPATNSSAYGSPLCIGPGAIVRAYNVHLLRRVGFPNGRITLAASALSRLDFSPPSHAAYSPTSGLLHAECRKCTSLKNRLGHRVLDPPTLLAMVSEHSVDAFGKGIRIRGHITKCLEFSVCRVNRDSVHRPCATAPSELVFSIRFIVTDGSGGALVQLGPKIPPLRCNPADLYSDSAGRSNEHARLLFGLNPTSWDRLLTQIAGFVTYPDYQFAVRFEETGTSDSPTLVSALRVFLTSPAFLRPHLLHLRRLPAPGKSVPRWRLRDLRLTSSDDTSTQSSRTETLSIVLPPLQLCALLAVEPFDA